jgi:3-hydroxyacyl-[acyl-carrier-protein] dehydratase
VDYEALLRQHRKRLLTAPGGLRPLAWGREDIKRILPHREPFLLLDRLTGVSFEEETITGARTLSPEDPVFAGHFPEFPVYPGCLEVEMIGQLGLCLHYFLESRSTEVPEKQHSLRVRATRIVGAHYLEPVLPGREVALVARTLDHDEYFAKVIGQAVADGKVACVAIAEVCFISSDP